MEQENARRVQHEEQLAEKRLKLDYEDLDTGDTGAGERWEELLARGRGVTTEELRQGVSDKVCSGNTLCVAVSKPV